MSFIYPTLGWIFKAQFCIIIRSMILGGIKMSKIEEVRGAMVKAMKAGDKETKETLSMLLAALKNKAIDKREDLTEAEEIQVILKEIKQTKETLDMTRGSHRDY